MVKVHVNNKEIEVFAGATLKHAVLKADQSLYQQVLEGKAEIRDGYGNKVGIGGAVDAGFSYTIRPTKPDSGSR